MTATQRPLTGRKVLLIAVSAFGVIIAANMALVFAAVGSFPGLEVANTYVASQSFDTDRDAQERLGWTASASYVDGVVTLDLVGADGQPVKVAGLDVTIGRATTAAADQALAFVAGTGPFSDKIALAAGKWEVRINATAGDGTKFNRRVPIMVSP